LERTHRKKRKEKRKQIHLKTKEITWLRGRKSHLTLENKLLIYKAAMKFIWSYGIELWGCASKSNVVIVERSPNPKFLEP
jgi:hypothetical protein